MVAPKAILVAFAASRAVLAQQTPPSSAEIGTCVRSQRKEWRSLTDAEKKEYIDAELCLMSLPTQLGVPGARTRWDDLQWAHIVQSNFIHDVGQFLPWHRYFTFVHEVLLRTECNYTGAQPYWKQTLDTGPGNLAASPLWDPMTGFGGNGAGTDSCVVDGPFANLTLHLTEALTVENYCLRRSFNENSFQAGNQTYIDRCTALDNYDATWQCFHSRPGPHGSGHGGVGGTMSQRRASPGDPLFHLHHANLDRLWWEWQLQDLPARLTDMAGRNTPTAGWLGDWEPPSAAFTDYSGDPGNETTLAHVLWGVGLIPNATVGDVMDIRGEYLCFDYV